MKSKVSYLLNLFVVLSMVLAVWPTTVLAAAPSAAEVSASTANLLAEPSAAKPMAQAPAVRLQDGEPPIRVLTDPVVSEPVMPADTQGLPRAPVVSPFEGAVRETKGFATEPKLPANTPGFLDPVAQKAMGTNDVPPPLLNFEGIDNRDGVYPPDTDGQVGPNHYIQMVNLSTAIYDKSGNLLYGPFHPNELWPTGDPCNTTNDGDVVVLYDQLADRWLLTQFGLPSYPYGPFYQCIAVSKSPDPTDNPDDWYPYTFLVHETKMNDYPKLGVWPDGYYMSAPQFPEPGDPGRYTAGAWVFDRDAMLNGDPATFQYFDLEILDPLKDYFRPLPSNWMGSTPPPAGAPNYFVSVDPNWIGTDDIMSVFEFHVDWDTPANSTFSLVKEIQVEEFETLCPSTRSCIPQPDTTVGLDALSPRPMMHLWYRNFGDYETLVTNQTVDVGGEHAGIRWYEIREPGTDAYIFQQGTYAPDEHHRWMGSLAMDGAGNMALGYSISSDTLYPSIRYTGREAGDPLGEMSVEEGIIITGTGSQTGTGSRWGDYSAMSVDPVDDCTFWYTQQYIETTGNASWQTRIASFVFPSCLEEMGRLEGMVTDVATSDPIEHAMVSAAMNPTYVSYTGDDGSYAIPSIMAGTYTVTASAYGYQPVAVYDVDVTAGMTTTQDFALTKLLWYTVDGYVTDATTGWPLYASIEIEGYPGDTIWTDPETGYYSIDLASGIAYTFTVEAWVQGYEDEVRLVGPLTDDVAEDFALNADLAICAAPGYAPASVEYAEDFEATDGGYTHGGTQDEWEWGTPVVWPFGCASGTNCWGTDLDGNYNDGADYWLTSSVVDLSGVPGGSVLTANWWQAWNMEQGFDYAFAEVSINGGPWQEMWKGDTTSDWTPMSYGISAAAGGTVQFRWRLESDSGVNISGYYIDDVSITIGCAATSGGLVVGNVYNESNEPMVGARVINDSGEETTAVATPKDDAVDDAFYTLFSPAGSHVFTATGAYGYDSDVETVTVVVSDTVGQDFYLPAAPQYVVDGYVTDANTNWPLYANINIGAPEPISIWTDPATGYYSVTLYADYPYAFNVNAWAPGYETGHRVVTLSADATENFALDADMLACSAPGYALVGTISESFEDGVFPPPGWTVVNNGGDCTWAGDDPSGRGNLTGGTGQFAIADSDACGYETTMNTDLLSPIVDVSSLPTVTLEFAYDYRTFSVNESADVDLSPDGGQTWINVVHWNGDQRGPATFSQDVTAYLGGSTQAQVRFHYDSPGWNWWWEVDNVLLGDPLAALPTLTCVTPADGGLVVGNTYDENTGDPVVGAEIVNDTGHMAESHPTPADDAVDDGFYTLFSLSGSHTFTATRTNYGIDADTVAVIDGDVVVHDFDLPAGMLSASPTGLDVTLELGLATTEPLVMSNDGGWDAAFELKEKDRGFAPMGPFQSPDFVAKPFKQNMITGKKAGVSTNPEAPPFAAGDVIQTWPTGLTLGWGIGYNADADDLWVGDLAAGGGTDLAYRFLPDGTNTGDTFDLSWAGVFAADMAYNHNTGMLWVMDVGGDDCIHEVDPIGMVLTGNTICPGWSVSQRGLAYDPTTDTYFAGGWNDAMLYHFASDGTMLASVNTGIGIAGLAYNPDTQHVFAVDSTGATSNFYVLDAANNFALIGQFNVPGFGTGGAGLGIDCDGNLWAVEQNDQEVYQFESGEPTTICGADIPWLFEDPEMGTVVATGDETIDVTFDAAYVDQPGTYYAWLNVKHDTPYVVDALPVTMTVTPPASYGKLEGVVTGLGVCDENPAPLADAELFIESSDGMAWWMTTTDVSGTYQIWLDAGYSPLTVTVTAPDYYDVFAGVMVTQSETTVFDMDLRLLQPCLSYDPAALEATLEIGDSASDIFTLTNAGAGEAKFELVEIDLGFDPMLPMASGAMYAPVSGGPTAEQVGDLAPDGEPGEPSDIGLISTPYVPTAVLYDNGPLVTHPSGGAGGADASALQTGLGMGTYGIGHQLSAGNRIADDFTITDPAGWQIDTITFFAYQSFCGPPSTIDHVNLQIWDGPPDDPGSSVVFGDTTTNRLANTVWSNIYRVLDTALGNADRPIMANTVNVGITLPPGDYWLDWQSGGTCSSGPWAPPITILGQTTTGNALQYTGVWAAVTDGGTSTPQGFPFVIEGSVTGGGGGGGIPWLSEDPVTGTVDADSDLWIDVDFDASIPETMQPGEYYGHLMIDSNAPNTVTHVPVTMTLLPPDTWGKLEGTVTGLGYCDSDPAPLDGAELTVEAATGMNWLVTTDVSGTYTLWLDEAHSPLTLTFEYPDHVTEVVTDVTVVGEGTTTVDAGLRWEHPCLSVEPDNFHLTFELGMSGTLPLTLTNDGAADADFNLSDWETGFIMARPTHARPQTAPVPAAPEGEFAFSVSPNPPIQASSPLHPAPRLPEDVYILTHSLSQTIVQFNSVSCSAGGLHTDNSYLRVFDLAAFGITGDFVVTNVEVGIEDAIGAGGTQPVEVRLYTLDGALLWANMTLIGQASVNIPDQSLSHFSVPVTGVAPAGSILVVEFFTPNGQVAGHSLYVGSNNLGQTAPTYLAAADCGFPEPTDTAAIGFPDMHLVMNVTGETGGGVDAPWLLEDPEMGTVPADDQSVVTVTMDSAYVGAPGEYYATLNVGNDDDLLDPPMLPVTMTVLPPASWGKLEGTVNSLGYCDAMTMPLAGAEVLIQSWMTDTFTVTATLMEEDFEGTFPPAGWTLTQTGATDDPGWQQTMARANSGSYSAYHNDDSTTGNSISWMILPQVTVPASNAALTFWQNQNYSTWVTYHGIWVSTATDDPADFVELVELGAGTEDTWEEKVIDLSGYANQDIYLAFRYEGDYSDEWYVDDVSITGDALAGLPIEWLVTTDVSGTYSLWLDEMYSPLTVTVTHPDHAMEQKSGVMVTATETTVEDFDLRWLEPCVSVEPMAIDETVDLGLSATVAMSLYNTGAAATDWDAYVYSIWLDTDPFFGTLAADTGFEAVTATLDAGMVDQPGVYTSLIEVVTNDPVEPSIYVPVTMTVPIPATYGRLEGVIYSTGHCDADMLELEGADVEIENVTGTVALLTSDVDGTYGYWLPAGTYTVTVTEMDHISETAVLTITAGVTDSLDFSLRWIGPCLTDVAPESMEVTVAMGMSETLPLSMTNDGAGELGFNFIEMDGGFVPTLMMPLQQAVQASTVVWNEEKLADECAVYQDSILAEPAEAWACYDYVPEPGVFTLSPLAPTDMGYAQDIGYISDNFVTFMLNDFPGQTVLGTSTNAYYGMDFDPSGTTLYALNDTTAQLGTIDLADGSFTPLVPCAAPSGNWTGLTIDPVSGDFYASDATSLYTIDPATGASTLVGAFGGGVTLMIDIAMNTDGEMYGHDIATDSIYQIDPATGAAMQIGATGYDANYAQGMDFDNDDGTLYIFLYQGGGANVYGTVDLATGAVTPLAVSSPAGEFEGAVQTAGWGDVPWLFEDPETGAAPAEDTFAADIIFDAGVPEVTHPGDYMADLILRTDDPVVDEVTLPVTMHVTLPDTYGYLDGTVYSLGYCDAEMNPLEGAEVLIESATGGPWMVTTGVSGTFDLWLDEAGAPYTITAMADEHDPAMLSGVLITGTETTTLDVELTWLEPCVNVDPPAIHETVSWGMSTTLPMTIGNTGAYSLTWSLGEEDRGFQMMRPTPLASGGPDTFGYVFADSAEANGPAYSWVDIAATGTSVFLSDDDWDGPFPIGFTFDFYGNGYTDFYMGSNGFLSFGSGSTSLSNQNLPSTSTPNNLIALMWDDLDPGDTMAPVYYQTFAACPYGSGACLVVEYQDYYHYPGGGTPAGTWEAILFENGSILIQFEDVGAEAGSSATTGIENIDGTDGLTYLYNAASLYNELAVCFAYPGTPPNCGGGGVPWLDEIPTGGETAPAGASPVTVTLDAGVPEITQPGDYYATLMVGSDDPMYDALGVPVTMTVEPPATWAKIEGTVTSLGYCDANPAPLEGAEVRIIGTGSAGIGITITTDISGNYSYWLDEAYGPLFIYVDYPDHEMGEAESVPITATETTVVDFALPWLEPCVSMSRDKLEITLAQGETAEVVMDVINDGSLHSWFGGMEWNIGFDPMAPLAAGGPDGFGYEYADSNDGLGPVYDFVDVSGFGAELALKDNEYAEIDIGFDFAFYGDDRTHPNIYDTLFVGSNGFLSFGSGSTARINQNLPDPTLPNNLIAAMWDDLAPGAAGKIYYQSFGECPYNPWAGTSDACLIVQYDGYEHADGDMAGTFEVILFHTGSILMQFAEADAPDATTGIENRLGLDGLSYGPALADELAICFAYPGQWTDCQATDIPWLAMEPEDGEVGDHSTTPMTVTFDASVPEVVEPGVYMAELWVQSHDPITPFHVMPVTMTVTQFGGKLAGTVTGWGYCDTTSETLDGAELWIEGYSGAVWQAEADANGDYQIWLDEGDNPYTITVEHVGYATQSMGNVDVTNAATTQFDLDLRVDKPCFSVSPGSYDVVVAQGRTHTETLDLINNGAGLLEVYGLDPNVEWLRDASNVGMVAANSMDAAALVFDAAGMDFGSYTGILEVMHNDAGAGRTFVRPINMLVVGYMPTLDPITDTATGDPDTTVVYSLTLTNDGTYTDTFDVAASGGGWTATVPSAIGPLGVGASTVLNVSVDIPATAQEGYSDTVTVTVTSQGDDMQTADAMLTTTAMTSETRVFLPLVLRNF